MYPLLQDTIDTLLPQTKALPTERTARLDQLAAFITAAHSQGRAARLNFICTHNSRRSHLGQIWAQTAAAYFHVEAVETFSGGTEATAFNPRAVAALERAGFVVTNPGGENPRYEVSFDAKRPAQVCFSKTYDDRANPTEHFAAIMTCTDADENCPVVFGSSLRLSLPYEDPKSADGTNMEKIRYDERSDQIATEMLYVFSRVSVAS